MTTLESREYGRMGSDLDLSPPGSDLPVVMEVRGATVELDPEPCFLPNRWVEYDPSLAEEIVNCYAAGESLLKLSRRSGFPSVNTLYKWHRENEEFREKIQQARVTRALSKEERADDLAETALASNKDDVAGVRLAFDIHRWGAEVNDPATYGKKTTVQGDSKRPLVFQVVSHIPDAEKPVDKLVEALVEEESLSPEPPDEGPNAT